MIQLQHIAGNCWEPAIPSNSKQCQAKDFHSKVEFFTYCGIEICFYMSFWNYSEDINIQTLLKSAFEMNVIPSRTTMISNLGKNGESQANAFKQCIVSYSSKKNTNSKYLTTPWKRRLKIQTML